jgi:hypothetical protein
MEKGEWLYDIKFDDGDTKKGLKVGAANKNGKPMKNNTVVPS